MEMTVVEWVVKTMEMMEAAEMEIWRRDEATEVVPARMMDSWHARVRDHLRRRERHARRAVRL